MICHPRLQITIVNKTIIIEVPLSVTQNNRVDAQADVKKLRAIADKYHISVLTATRVPCKFSNDGDLLDT